ncbi:MAG: hypothetical protein N3D85_06950 [Candidatus Bathyarchaeota archaeon]|nr:hypothetical protein [Candidatus Bathyarchaeota archaeon]
MSEKSPSKDEALEALDFIVNVLKEHEKDLDQLISELGAVAGNLGEVGGLSEKVTKVEDKINGLQNQVTTLLNEVVPSLKQTQPTAVLAVGEEKFQAPQINIQKSPALVLTCNQWADFQAIAMQAEAVSFTYEETKKILNAMALKNNQLFMYKGEIPNIGALLKAWLSKQLETPEKKILEGTLTIN